MAHWVGTQGQVNSAKKMQKHPHLGRHSQRTRNPKLKSIFSIGTRRQAECVDGLKLNMSLAPSTGELWVT